MTDKETAIEILRRVYVLQYTLTLGDYNFLEQFRASGESMMALALSVADIKLDISDKEGETVGPKWYRIRNELHQLLREVNDESRSEERSRYSALD